jgi:hypothetical protein
LCCPTSRAKVGNLPTRLPQPCIEIRHARPAPRFNSPSWQYSRQLSKSHARSTAPIDHFQGYSVAHRRHEHRHGFDSNPLGFPDAARLRMAHLGEFEPVGHGSGPSVGRQVKVGTKQMRSGRTNDRERIAECEQPWTAPHRGCGFGQASVVARILGAAPSWAGLQRAE